MNGNADDPHRYDDIIDLPHATSKTHSRMSLANRAAQFAPFAALSGYDAAIQETARLTDRRIELDEGEKLAIGGRLQRIREHIRECPEATFTYFQPDAKKRGGSYAVATGNVKKVDEHERVIVLTSGTIVPMDEVIAVDGELLKDMDERFT